jgi:hypothetical protein
MPVVLILFNCVENPVLHSLVPLQRRVAAMKYVGGLGPRGPVRCHLHRATSFLFFL